MTAPRPATLPAPPREGAARESQPAAWYPRSQTLGVYLHIPFCRQRCHYCSFNTGPYDPAGMDRFLRALLREIDLVGEAGWAGAIRVGTVFFGGGTPSLLEPGELSEILGRLRRRFTVAPDAEITVECNPESVSLARLEGYRRAGVNRLSLGVQSLDGTLLARLGRLHSAREAEAAFEAARVAGIANVNVDVMYGLPELDSSTWEATLREVLAWRPEHVSAYCLTLDEGSRWAHDPPRGLPSEDAITEQYWLLARLALEARLEHYEISNYCRPGFQCRHNLLYWRGEEYVGLGPGGSGHLGGVRYTNVKPVQRYCSALEAGAFPLAQWERLTARQRQAERLILGLRLREGVPRTWLDARVADGPEDVATIVDRWRGEGFLIADEDRVRLTEAGFLLSDSLFVDLL